MKRVSPLIAVTALAAAAALGALGSAAVAGDAKHRGLPQGSEPVKLNPADFTIDIDNPYWPMSPGSRWVYTETEPGGPTQDVVVEVTDRTKQIANGIEARVVVDTVTENGVPVEITEDWYAQDEQGNVWYLGEYVTNYENGQVVDHEGSFEAGVDGAQAGIAMPANPKPGLSYRQEYYEGEAEDKATVITVGKEQVEVPFGYFNKRVLMTRDLVPTEPKVQELKFYVPDVGPVLSMHTDGPGSRAALVSYEVLERAQKTGGMTVPDDELQSLSREALVEEVLRLRVGIRQHRDSTGHELCWHHPQLWGLLPETTDVMPAVPIWPEFLRGCIRYRQSLDDQLPDAARTDQPYTEHSSDC